MLRLRHGQPIPQGQGGDVFDRMVDNVIRAVERKQIPSGQYQAVLLDEGHDFRPEWFKLLIIVGTILAPLAQSVGMHPIHFAIIGVISIAYGLVTPPYGLCLMIACTVGGIKIMEAIRDTAILFVPMLLVLVLVLLFVVLAPDAMLWLLRMLMPTLVK
jgi:TRAP-type mannitol/chloroaromatic compound transport system permease large subunit